MSQAQEERIAHLEREVSELSEQLARQQTELDLLRRRLGLLMEREAEREADSGDSVALVDQRPPHW